MPDHLVILVLAVGGLVAFLIYKGTAAARARKEERRRDLRALGFEPLDSPPPEVADPILALYGHGGKSGHKLDNVFERPGSADRFYLLDLKSSSGDSSQEGVIAVFSPRLRMPRLTIFPRLEGDGRLAALGNLLMKKLSQRHGGAVDFAAHPRFTKRHFVSGPDEAAIRRFLTGDRLDRLAELEHTALEGEGALFTYQKFRFPRHGGGTDREQISEHVQQAEQLLRLLRA
jgi:hypothetical protein